MDPTACWNRLNDAVMDGDAEGFLAACEDLQEWVTRGGAYPKQWTAETAGAWLVIISHVTTLRD